MKLNYLILIGLFFTLVSCDPMKIIAFENNLSSESTVKFYFQGSGSSKFDNFITKDSLIINLQPNEKKMYDFGMGSWEINNSIDSLVSRVKMIKIETAKSKIIFKEKKEVESFFKERLIDDRNKASIIIKIE